jgi:hypothetical protein
MLAGKFTVKHIVTLLITSGIAMSEADLWNLDYFVTSHRTFVNHYKSSIP